ncbi:hypothetical protein QOT17_017164 [Balamuthia mandrillaris]
MIRVTFLTLPDPVGEYAMSRFQLKTVSSSAGTAETKRALGTTSLPSAEEESVELQTIENRPQRLERLVANAEESNHVATGAQTRERVEHWKPAVQACAERLAIHRPTLSNAAKAIRWCLFFSDIPVSYQATPIARALHTVFIDAWKTTKWSFGNYRFFEFLATHPSIRFVRPNAPWTSEVIVPLALKHLPHIREVKQSKELEGMTMRQNFKRYWKEQLEEMVHELEPALLKLQEGEIPEVYPTYPPCAE